ncbi:transporter [Psychromonas sp. CNPT3]|uniref:purine nucleoside transporter PunC n=1 Tax=Psychromonas sp. CNPT3 TaxID=314282 RepID=UPI00006E76A8|nr:purine nucleoside transporter PunC [Psychromonas sp. CNPT3]AGH80622.1 transporter [Psychromonas sp. CNPT3]
MHNKNKAIPYIWLSGLSMLGFLATDMYLPAFDVIRQDLGTSQQMIGWSLTIFLFGMAGGQLVYGPLTQRFGKKLVLSASLLIFSIGSIMCALSTQIEGLLFGRLIQALGACGSTIIWQSYVMEKYDAKTSQRIFATIMPLVALSPALAPLLGAVLEAHLGWQTIFYALILIGSMLMLRANLIDFSTPQQENMADAQSVPKLGVIAQYIEILKSKKFTGNMLIYATCSAAFFAWLTGSPFAMTAMGYSGTDIGFSYLPQTAAFIIGGYTCRTLLNKYASQQILPWLLKLFILSVIVMFVVATQFTTDSIIPLLIPMCFMAMANGAIYPIVANKALSEFSNNSASAAGLMNFLQMMFCVIASGIVSALSEYGVVAMTAVMLAQAVLVVIGYGFIAKSNKAEMLEVAKAS